MTLSDAILGFYKFLLGQFVSELIVALLILFVGMIFGRICGRAVQALLKEIDFDKNIGKFGFNYKLANIISTSASYVIYFISVIFALMQFGMVAPVFYSLVVFFLAVFFASAVLTVKEFFPNLFSGLYVKFKPMMNEGEIVRVHNVEGKVEHIGLVKTKIISRKGDVIFLNNSVISKNKIVKLKK
jgi:small-conductance mechanosensitive channel